MQVASFAIDTKGTVPDGPFLVLPGKCFEVGDYPDKQFSLSESEADKAVTSFSAVAMNDEHRKRSVLSKKDRWGKITSLWRQGSDLHATFSIPRWLAEFAREDGEPLKVSLEWDTRTKRVVGGAWTDNPRIEGAFVAVFSRDDDVGKPPKGNNRMNRVEAYRKRCEEEDREPDADALAAFSDLDKSDAASAAASIRQNAVAFSNEMLTAKHLNKDSTAAAAALFAQLSRDDADNATVNFSLDENDATTGSRVELFRAFVQTLPKNTLKNIITSEVVQERAAFGINDTTTQTKTEADKKASDARVQTMLNSTTTGRAALEAQK